MYIHKLIHLLLHHVFRGFDDGLGTLVHPLGSGVDLEYPEMT